MAVTADKVVVELELRDGQYLARVRQNERAFTTAQNRVAQSAEATERRVRASSAGIASSLRSAAAGIAAGVSATAITRLADTYTQLQNRLKVTGLEGAALEKQYDRLNQVATDSRTGIEETVQVYSRLRLATEGLGLTNEQVTRTTEILGKALSSSGASASETSAALLQFSQAIGSGVLQGDELRSIRENAPAVARAIAKEFGVTVGELKKLGEEGELTSDRVVQAVLKSGTEIDALFAKTEKTVGNALTNLGNQLINYIGQTDDSLSATERLAGAINLMADNLDTIVPILTTVVTLVGVRYVGAMTGAAVASLAAARAAGTLGASTLALAGGPFGLAAIAITAIVFALVKLNEEYGRAGIAARELAAVTDAGRDFLSRYEKAQYDAANATRENAKAADDHVAALKREGAEIIRVAQLNARRRVQEAQQQRAEADRAVASSVARQRGQGGRSFSNASVIQDQAARQRATTEISQATAAKEDADKAIAALADLQRTINAPRQGLGGGGGGGRVSSRSGGGSRSPVAAAASNAADELNDLRADLARIQDAQLTDAQRASKELAETIAIIDRAAAGGLLTEGAAARLGAGAAGINLQPFERREITPLDIDTSALNPEDRTEEFQNYARSFVDVLRSDDIWESLGQKFADGAAENLTKSLGNLLMELASQSNGSGSFLSSALGFIGGAFGGGRAIGGGVRAGFSYDVGENGREKFVAPANGYIVPNMENLSRPAGGSGMAFSYSPVYNVSGYGQDIEGLKQQMEADRKGFRNNVTAAVNDGVQRRKIRLG